MRLIVSLVVVCRLLVAADLWNDKKPEEWSAEEIRKLVTDSPWATEAQVVVKRQSRPAGSSDRSAPPIAFEAPARRDQSDSAGGSQRPAVTPASPEDSSPPRIVVRWESASLVCDACALGNLEAPFVSCASKLLYLSGLGDKFAELRKNYYIISMSNYPRRAVPGTDAPQHSAAATKALEQFGKRLQETAVLIRNGKDSIAPDQVVIVPSGTGFLVMVFFPRSAAISATDRELSFVSTSEQLEVKSKFRPQNMLYNNRLDL